MITKYKIFLFSFCAFLCVFPVNLFSQTSQLDSLKLALKNAKNDTVRCNILSVLTEISDDEEWPRFNEQLKVLSEKNISNNSKPKKIFFKYLSISFNNIGYLAEQNGNIPMALEFYNKSLKIREEIGDKQGIANSLYSIGGIYINQGNIPKALDYNHRSLKIQEEIGSKTGIANSLYSIGSIYSNQGDMPKALEYSYKSLKIREEIGDKFTVAYSLINIGAIYNNIGEISKAMDCFHKSLKLQEELGDKEGIASSLNNIGAIYNSQGDITKAIEYQHKCLKIREEIGDKRGLAFSLDNLATLNRKIGKVKEALDFANKGMQVAKDLGFPENIKNSANTLKKIFQEQKNYKDALEMFELEIKMRDSINNESTRKASIKQQLKHEYETRAAADSVAHAKESEIKNAEIAKQTAEIKAKKNQQYALFGGLGLVMIFAGFMYNRFKVTQKQKGIIESQKEIVEEQKKLVEEKQKEILDSIHYAKRIQMAQVPSEKRVQTMLRKLRR